MDPIRSEGTQIHGIVVWYHNSEHDPKEPRIRWDSGWGTSENADGLRLLTQEECGKYPKPQLSACDIKKMPPPLPMSDPVKAVADRVLAMAKADGAEYPALAISSSMEPIIIDTGSGRTWFIELREF